MPSSNAIQETISECISQLAQSNCAIESQTNALKTLASLTKVSTRNRHLLSQTHDSVPTILDLSRSSVSEIQTLALSVLFNLSLNPNLKRALAHPTTISHLNSLILPQSSSLPEVTFKVVSALVCSLAMLDKNKAVFGVSGTIQAIIKALCSDNISTSSSHNLLSSLVELMQFHGNCTLAVKLGLVETLVDILSDSVTDLWSSCLSILSLLARFEEGIKSISEVEGVLELLFKGLSKGCMVSRESSADIMIKLFERKKDLMMTMNVVESSEMMCLLADLSIRGSKKAREKAGILMKTSIYARPDEPAFDL